MIKKLILLIIILLIPSFVWADCTGSSPTWTFDTDSPATAAALQTCIDNATAGDTINISAGSYTWSTQVTITKALNLIGAGVGITNITSSYSGSGYACNDSASGLIVAPSTPADNPIIRISGMSINFGTANFGIMYSNSSTAYDCNRVRFDHINMVCTKPSTGNDEIHFGFCRVGLANGVFDSSTIDVGSMDMTGDSLWDINTELASYRYGSVSNFYFEDNVWQSTHNPSYFGQAGTANQRYAFRYNTINIGNGVTGSPIWDQHGDESIGSCMGAEIYGNDIVVTGTGAVWLTSDQRAGKWIFFNNRMTGETTAMRVREEYSNTNTQDYSGQHTYVEDSYYWGNIFDGSVVGADDSGEHVTYSGHSVPEENYSFYNYNASWTPGNALTTGVACGTLANRPTTCTTGVGYWATDQSCTSISNYVGAATPTGSRTASNYIQGTLYKCGAGNTWSELFTPYTYPHPLRAEGTTPPSAQGCTISGGTFR